MLHRPLWKNIQTPWFIINILDNGLVIESKYFSNSNPILEKKKVKMIKDFRRNVFAFATSVNCWGEKTLYISKISLFYLKLENSLKDIRQSFNYPQNIMCQGGDLKSGRAVAWLSCVAWTDKIREKKWSSR